MEFWIGLVLFCCLCIVTERLLPKPLNSMIPYVLLVSLWFISSFRYMIGWDYESYITMFNSVEYGNIYPEISFIMIADFCRNMGFDFQIIFVIYTSVFFIFMWLGIKNYTLKTESSIRVLALVLFAMTPLLYWNSFSIIRQAVAVSIFFWGTKYILSRKFVKYLLVIVFATFWHYSAIVLIGCYWICNLRLKKIYYILLLFFMLILSITNFIPFLLGKILPLIGIYESYLIEESAGFSSGLTAIFSMILFGFCLFVHKTNDKYGKILINMYCISLFTILVLNFSKPLYRMRMYFEIFYIVLLSRSIYCMNTRYNLFFAIIVLLPIMAFFLNVIYLKTISVDGLLHPYFSASNIEYMFNFKLFK